MRSLRVSQILIWRHTKTDEALLTLLACIVWGWNHQGSWKTQTAYLTSAVRYAVLSLCVARHLRACMLAADLFCHCAWQSKKQIWVQYINLSMKCAAVYSDLCSDLCSVLQQ